MLLLVSSGPIILLQTIRQAINESSLFEVVSHLTGVVMTVLVLQGWSQSDVRCNTRENLLAKGCGEEYITTVRTEIVPVQVN